MDSLLGLIGMGSIALILILLIIGIISYFLSSIALMRMSQNAGVDEAWLAWIPVGNLYIVGRLIKSIEFGGKSYDQAEIILPGVCLAGIALGRLALVGSVVNMGVSLVTFYGFYSLFKCYAPERTTKYMVMSVLLPVIGMSIALFRIRDFEPVA
jgi:hypothetical protein